MRKKDYTGQAQRVTVPFAVKEAKTEANGEMKFDGYGSVFDVIDYYDEKILAGAFEETLAKHKKEGSMPALLWQHKADQVPGRWLRMKEDDKGLWNEGELLPTTLGKDTHILLKANAVRGLSIGFNIMRWEMDEEHEILLIKAVDLWEVSLVTFPANPAAMIEQVKAVGSVRDFELFLRDAGFSREDAKIVVARGFKHLMEQREAADGGDEAAVVREMVESARRNTAALKS